jgi:hypothetical protein
MNIKRTTTRLEGNKVHTNTDVEISESIDNIDAKQRNK